MNNLFSGARYVLKGFRLITRPGVKRYVVIPLLINTLLFASVIGFGSVRLGALIERFIPAGWEWLSWIVWPVFLLIVLALVFFGFTALANLVGAPFNGLLAAAVEAHLTGHRIDNLNQRGMVREALTVMASEVQKLAYIAVRALPCLILFLIPGVQVAAPFLWFLFGAWMLAFEYADYPMANHGLSFKQQRKTLASKRALTLGFGAAVMLLALVPLLNFLVMPTAVAGATALWVERLDDGAHGN